MTIYTRTLAALAAVALALVAIVTPGPRAVDAQTSRYAVYATSRTTLTSTGRDLAVASSAASALSTIGGVASTRTIAGLDLSADRTADALRSALSLPATAAAPSTTPLLLLRADAGVTDDGTGRVSSWASQGSVSSVNFSAPSSGRRPLIVKSGSPSGRDVIFFDAARPDTLTTPGNGSLDASSALTVVFVGVIRAGNVVFERPHTTSHSDPYCRWWVYAGSSGNAVDLRVASSTLTVTTASTEGHGAWRRPAVHIYRLAAGVRQYRVNGYNITTSATGATVTYPDTQALRLGSNASDGEAVTGWYYEVRLYSGSLTDAQCAEIEAEVSQRWGIPLVFG